MRIRIPNTASRDIFLTGRLIFNIFEKQFVMYTIQYKGTFLYLHEEPSLVYRFVYILAYVYYIFFFLVLGCKIANFAKTSCASTLANSHADYLTGLTGLSGASCAAFLKAYFRLVGKKYNCFRKKPLSSLSE
jgi:hypothetical protein